MNKGPSLNLDMFSLEEQLPIFSCFLETVTARKQETAASGYIRVLWLP